MPGSLARKVGTTVGAKHILDVATQLGGIYPILVLCVVLAVAEMIRKRSVWVIPFIVAVMGGEEILTGAGSSAVDEEPRQRAERTA